MHLELIGIVAKPNYKSQINMATIYY